MKAAMSLRLTVIIVFSLIRGSWSHAEQMPVSTSANIAALKRIATESQCAAHRWAYGRGVAPESYIQGVTLVFARAICQPLRSDVHIVSAPVNTSLQGEDALFLYQSRFQAFGMSNNQPGLVTLRHAYALLIGLGMMESSGKYCEGRDVSECFTTADSAEAGLFQASFGARMFSKDALMDMFSRYKRDQSRCLLSDFEPSITCHVRSSHNPKCPSSTNGVAGTGEGANWQRLTKSCPAFATEYAAVLLRKHGGLKGEFNPIRKQQAELRPECDSMLGDAQSFVLAHPDICSSL